MTDTRTCSVCSKENPHDATLCASCGAPLLSLLPSRTTSHIEAPVLKPTPSERAVQLTRLYSDILVFQIAGYDQPALVKASAGKVTVGRYSPGEIPPILDLTPYNASAMGVSRQHAVINRQGNGYSIQDLGSTNGTWLNETRLSPQQAYEMKTGDTLRLGQVTMLVYFRTADESTEDILNLHMGLNALVPFKLSLKDLQSAILPYLNTLAAIQSICNEALDQPFSEMMIGSLSVENSNPVISVKVAGVHQAVRLVRSKGAVWREMHLETIEYLSRAREVRSTTGEFVNGKTGKLREALNVAIIELAQDFLSDLMPERSTSERQTYQERLAMQLHALALSPIRLLTE